MFTYVTPSKIFFIDEFMNDKNYCMTERKVATTSVRYIAFTFFFSMLPSSNIKLHIWQNKNVFVHICKMKTVLKFS